MTQKEQILKAVADLPEAATVDDAIEQLFLLSKVLEGLNQSAEGKGTPHEEIKKRYLKS